jgi:Bifunctional DNA primase/polymerase, N-terminal
MSYMSDLAIDLSIIAENTSIKGNAAQAVLNGWKILPVKSHNKLPHFDLIKRGHLDATDNWKLIDFWFSIDPKMNYGINCQASGLVVLDIDFRNGGLVQEWMKPTYTVSTGDGLHLYYATDELRFVGQVGEGIDVKHKGFVVGEGSIHSNGKTYTKVVDMPVVELDDEMKEMIGKW